MKKIIMLLCAMGVTLGLTACGGTKPENIKEDSQQSVENAGDTVGDTEGDTAGTGADGNMDGEASESWSEEMQSIKNAVVNALGDNYWPIGQVMPEMLEDTYGITADLYDDYMGEVPMISVNVDTLLVIKAKEGKVEDVKAALDTYRDNLIADTMQYPMNVGKIQASQVEVIGNYVCFIQLGADTMEASEQGDDAVITHCQEQNGQALEAIKKVIGK